MPERYMHQFKIRNYSYDVSEEGGSPTLRIFGTNAGAAIELTITNPTQEMIMSLMHTYDSRYEMTATDIRLLGEHSYEYC